MHKLTVVNEKTNEESRNSITLDELLSESQNGDNQKNYFYDEIRRSKSPIVKHDSLSDKSRLSSKHRLESKVSASKQTNLPKQVPSPNLRLEINNEETSSFKASSPRY
jgi:hypothetical protein